MATVAKPDMMATSYGVYHAVIGLAALPSGIIGGALWQHLGSQAMFLYGAGMALFSSLLFMLLVPLRKS